MQNYILPRNVFYNSRAYEWLNFTPLSSDHVANVLAQLVIFPPGVLVRGWLNTLNSRIKDIINAYSIPFSTFLFRLRDLYTISNTQWFSMYRFAMFPEDIRDVYPISVNGCLNCITMCSVDEYSVISASFFEYLLYFQKMEYWCDYLIDSVYFKKYLVNSVSNRCQVTTRFYSNREINAEMPDLIKGKCGLLYDFIVQYKEYHKGLQTLNLEVLVGLVDADIHNYRLGLFRWVLDDPVLFGYSFSILLGIPNRITRGIYSYTNDAIGAVGRTFGAEYSYFNFGRNIFTNFLKDRLNLGETIRFLFPVKINFVETEQDKYTDDIYDLEKSYTTNEIEFKEVNVYYSFNRSSKYIRSVTNLHRNGFVVEGTGMLYNDISDANRIMQLQPQNLVVFYVEPTLVEEDYKNNIIIIASDK